MILIFFSVTVGSPIDTQASRQEGGGGPASHFPTSTQAMENRAGARVSSRDKAGQELVRAVLAMETARCMGQNVSFSVAVKQE